MNYSVVHAFAKPMQQRERWKMIDLEGYTIQQLYTEYLDVWIELDHPTFEDHWFMKLSEVRDFIEDSSMTVESWLLNLDINSVPSHKGQLQQTKRHWQWRDGWVTGFDIQRTKMGTHPTNEWPIKDKKDLLITGDVDYNDLYNHCLVTVNGLLHRTSYSEYGLYVVRGGESVDISGRTQVGMLSFKDVAPIEIVDINSDMLYRPKEDMKYYHRAYLNLGVKSENKTVLLSIGGYLHTLDSLYKVIGNGLIQIDFSHYPIIQRYYESNEVINLESIPYTEFERNPEQRMVDELIRSEVFIKALLDLPQTFAILVDSSDIYVHTHQLERSGFTGTFLSHSRPLLPLKTKRGRMMEYASYDDDGIWVVDCEDNLIPNYQFETSDYESFQSVAPWKTPSRPFREDRGFLVELGIDILQKK